jgi:hypothetical protein
MSSITVEDIERDRPLAEVRPLAPTSGQPRPYGLCAGQFSVPEDFNEPLPENLLKEFGGNEILTSRG